MTASLRRCAISATTGNADEGVKQQELRGQVGKRVTGGVVGSGGAEMKCTGKRNIEGKRGEMQRIDAGEAAPEEAAD